MPWRKREEWAFISAAQIGYDDPDFRKDPEAANLRALRAHIARAREISEGNGMIAVNLMAVTQLYGDYVRVCAEAGADAIISGAGLPSHLPKYAKNGDICLAPIVSSEKIGQSDSEDVGQEISANSRFSGHRGTAGRRPSRFFTGGAGTGAFAEL